MHKSIFTFPLLLSVLAFAPAISAQPAPNAVGGPVTVLSPFNFWSNAMAGRFYNPTGIVIGSNYFLYVHGGAYNYQNGGPGSECHLTGEQILIFETPYTFDNIRSTAYGPPLYTTKKGPWTYVGIASPCAANHYSIGSVFKSSWDGQYKLLVDLYPSGGGTSWSQLTSELLLTSPDGISWAPQKNLHDSNTPPLLYQSTIAGSLISVGEVAMVQGASEWWGTFAFGTVCGCQTGRIRVFQSATNLRGYVAYIWSTDSQWHAVNDDGTFDYMPANTQNAADPMGTVSIVSHLGGYEAWGAPAVADSQALDPLDPGCALIGESGKSAIIMATIEEGTADNVTPPPAIGPSVYVTSSLDTNSNHHLNWPLASQDLYGRIYPVRFDDAWGKYVLLTSSLDAVCWAGITSSSWRGMEIVLTTVDK